MKASFKTLSITLLGIILFFGCNEPMESISQITKFRVMGIKAEPPEIAPGEGTTLEVLFADPRGNGREITILWMNCLGDMSMESDVASGCEPIWYPQFQTYEEDGHQYQVPFTPPEILDNLPADQDSLDVTVIAVLCAGGDLDMGEDDSMPEGDISSLDQLCEGGDGLVAIKPFKISNSKTPNQNPVIDKFFFGGLDEDFEITPEGEQDSGMPEMGYYECTDSQGCREGTTVDVKLVKESFEIYNKTTFGVVSLAVEDPYISWFVAGIYPQELTGQFSADRSRIIVPEDPGDVPNWEPDFFTTDWSPPRDGGMFRMWAVVHDARGGINWKSYIVEAVVPTS